MKKSSVFFGTPDFALPSLRAALEQTRVLAVITQPDKPRGRGQQLAPCEVKALAVENGLAVFSPPSLRKASDELARLRAWIDANPAPDFVLVTAYGNILPQTYLDWSRIGPINVHASLLPRWRGAAPIQRCLEAGDSQTGVALQRMVYELDAGDVLAEQLIQIDRDLRAPDLWGRLSEMGGTLLGRFLERFEGDRLHGRPQDATAVTLAPKLRKEEGFWKPEWTPTQTHHRIRAFAGWPGVKAVFNGQPVKLCRSSLVSLKAEEIESFRAGALFQFLGGIFLGTPEVRAGESIFLKLEEIQFPGKSAANAADALRNYFRDRQSGVQLEFQPLA